MWKQWKSKLNNILHNDETESKNQDQSHPVRNKQELKAKMTYQYPENKSFRFPVIPDEPVRNKQPENKPAYMRKKDERKQNPSPKAKRDDQMSRKIYKNEDAPPFALTDVPSPVYGFQKQKQTIENVPAFQRKQDVQEVNETVVETFEQIIPEKQEVSTEPVEEKVSPLEERTEESIVSETAEVETIPEDILVNLIQSKTENEKQEKSEIKTIQQMTKEKNEKEAVQNKPNPQQGNQRPKSRAERRRENKNKQVNTIPYNVMMTPQDRRQIKVQQRYSNKVTELHPQKKKQNETVNQNTTFSPKQEVKEIQVVQEVPEVQEVTTNEMHIPFHLLNDPVPVNNENDIWIEEQQGLLEQTLKHFNVGAKVVKATQGPSVTRFEVQPDMGVKVSKIRNLSDDLKLNMSARDIRIEAPIPGKNTVGIEVPNPQAQMVGLQEVLDTEEFKENESPLTIALGLTIEGNPKITNIQKMPHGLIAGATGSGKSVCINTILISILYKASHEDVKFLLIDPKMVELAPYNGIPHLVAPVITNVKAATQSLKWAVNEMEERYERFVEEGVRDLERYNKKVLQQGRKQDKMPYIVIVIDELADLMMMSPQDVENAISRIAQKARACGIHLLLATQRPSVDVITGLIKANIPTRIAFSVSSQVDSRTILDSSGADKLLGKGDMLFAENGTGKSVRLQGPFVSDDEIERVTNFAREIAEPNYLFEQEELLEQVHVDENEDELLDDAIQFVLQQQSASTSMIQRHFKVGYNRAARLIDTMEARGIISGQNGSKAREVLVVESMVEES